MRDFRIVLSGYNRDTAIAGHPTLMTTTRLDGVLGPEDRCYDVRRSGMTWDPPPTLSEQREAIQRARILGATRVWFQVFGGTISVWECGHCSTPTSRDVGASKSNPPICAFCEFDRTVARVFDDDPVDRHERGEYVEAMALRLMDVAQTLMMEKKKT